ncbi:RNA recognition motif domain protein family protein [Cryptosporidium meleagridis]|uniref:RNA recognition motif domain protein family protein n=1 Tax=Cryptosporidium meleagridis TaxID=93969 RepID=A0A2P4YYZ2_9CRYT|nr:RNA recognition motif domain protein family protein [Cryptosporidium meleagridis]
MTADVSGGGTKDEATSSRIIIKNLPSYLSEKRLKDHISSIGCNITDVKIVKKRSEKNPEVESSRKFGFVGFYSEEDAKKVLEYFNGTFIDTCRINVQYAFPPGSDLLPRPWSKYSVGSSQYNKRNNIKENTEVDEKEPITLSREDDLKKENFKKWISQKNSNKSWLDSADLIYNNEINSVKNDSSVKISSEIVKPTKAGVSNVRKHIQFSESGSDSDSDQDSELKNETFNESDGNSSTNVSESDLSSDSNTDSEDDQEPEEALDIGEQIVTSPTETSRLMVVNISYSTTEEDLIRFFSKWGEVKSANIICSAESGVSKGYGFVQYEFVEHAVSALSQAHLSLLHGRVLRVSPAFNKPTKTIKDSFNESNVIVHSNYKLKALNKKKESSIDKKTWNLLYISGNSAVNAFIDNEDVKKHDIVDVQAPDLASRVSLMETHVISATKEWLKKEGISVKAFEVEGSDIFTAKLKFEGVENVERSKDTIIIKHLPSDQVTLSDLQKICSPFGRVNRLCLSPSKTIAIVQFLEESAAEYAFKRLAFKRFKSVPLYIEWAPINLFVPETETQKEKETESKVVNKKEILDIDEDLDNKNAVHVFVKNLSFDTTNKALENLFSKVEGFRKATITMKTHSDSDGNIIKKSMGYGFLEFKTSEHAKECIKRMQSVTLDGHTLELKISKKSKTSQVDEKTSLPYGGQLTDIGVKNVSNKLLIKNLPFQATKSDIMSLFNSVGTVTSVRIPKKSDGTNKGYCFIEFLGKLEAISALEQFQHTHLYGRHLIIEVAENDDDSSPGKKKTRSV